jgi:hypothetical protein
MSISSRALYFALTQDLSKFLPNCQEVYDERLVSNIILPPDSGIKSIASLALLKSINRKNVDSTNGDSASVAIALFRSMNEHCKDYVWKPWAQSEAVLQVMTRAVSYLHRWLSAGDDLRFSVSDVLSESDFGPGASVGASGTSFYHKSGSSRLTCTDPLLYSMYIETLRYSPLSLNSEALRRRKYGKAEIVRGSKLSTVPKNTETDRVICTEPSLNMFVQKGLARVLEATLRRSVGIDLATQQFKNKRLARLGSKYGQFGTIDLSSASDTISLNLCRSIFPRQFMAWLDTLRSEVTTLPSGEIVELHMVSSMGNAFTFPLQTMIFSAITLACYDVSGIAHETSLRSDGNWGVFGDDIIVDYRVYDLVMSSLRAFGFLPNERKSFNTGLFRESCGGDYYCGRFVRGVYGKTLRNSHVRYSLINRLNTWSCNHGIPLANAIGYLLKYVRYLPIPPYEQDDAGIKVPKHMLKVLSYGDNGCIIYRRLCSRPNSISLDVEPTLAKMKKARIIYNPHAVFVSAIKGALRRGSLTLRLVDVKSYYKVGISPGWDYIDKGHSSFEDDGWSVWKQMTPINIGRC